MTRPNFVEKPKWEQIEMSTGIRLIWKKHNVYYIKHISILAKNVRARSFAENFGNATMSKL